MNKTGKIDRLLNNNKVILILSFFTALLIWLMVVINVSPETTRLIQGVKVVIDTTVPSQFDLEVFGENEFTVDVTVKGKKYLISPAALSADDIVVTAQTTNVDSAGKRTLQLKAESASGSSNYSVSQISQKTIDVYFDTPKTVQMVIEPDVITGDFEIVKDGYTTGDINLSESSVSVSGPSTEVNRIEKVVARLQIDKPLTSNKSADAQLVLLDDKGEDSFKYLNLDIDSVVLTIPVLQVKTVSASVTFKNAPDDYVLTPLKYTVSPSEDDFKILVDDYEKTSSYSVGTIDFKSLSPSNHVFTFEADKEVLSDKSETENYVADVDMTGFTQDYFTFPREKIKINAHKKTTYIVSDLNKPVVIVGTEKGIENITEDKISVEVDLSSVEIRSGQTVNVPAVVSVDSPSCWVYGTYSVDVTL